jgi:hypothetical protein
LSGNQEKKLRSLPVERKEQERELWSHLERRMAEMTVGGDEREI